MGAPASRCSRSSSRAAHGAAGAAREDRADPPAVRAEARVAHARVHVDAARVRSRSDERRSCTPTCCGSRASPTSGARSSAAFERALAGGTLPEPLRLKLVPRAREDREQAARRSRARARLPPPGARARARRSRCRAAPRGARDPARATGPSCSRRIAGAPRASTEPTRARVAAASRSRRCRRRSSSISTARPRRITRRSRRCRASSRALRALARIEEARGDWESLVDVLAQELEQTPDGASRAFDLLMRLGIARGDTASSAPAKRARATTAMRSRSRPPRWRRAPAGGRARSRGIVLAPDGRGAKLDRRRTGSPRRAWCCRTSSAAKQSPQQAAALEVIRAGEDDRAPPRRLELDRALMRLYHVDLGDPGAAWTAGLRVHRAPSRPMPRCAARSRVLAGQLGRDGEWARQLARGARHAASSAGRHVGGGPRGRDRARAARRRAARRHARPRSGRGSPCSRSRPTRPTRSTRSPRCIAAISAGAICARCSSAAPRSRSTSARVSPRCSSSPCSRRTCSAMPARAIAAYRRVLELDPAHLRRVPRARSAVQRRPSSGPSSRSCSRASADHDRRAAASRSSSRTAAPSCSRTSSNEPSRAVDLLEDVLGRASAATPTRASCSRSC